MPSKKIIIEGTLVFAGAAFFVSALLIPGSVSQIVGGSVLPYLSQSIAPAPPVPSPENVRAVHFSYSSFNPEKAPAILEWISGTDLNGIIFAVKDEVGRVAFFDPETKQYVEDFVYALHARGVYAIARIVVFQDNRLSAKRPDLAIQDSLTGGPWKTYAGAGWMDPTQSEVCEYNVRVAGLAVEAGFDEINFDYIRFPTDGPMSRLKYAYPELAENKDQVIASCLKHAREVLGDRVIISVDVFGMAFVIRDNGIGQDIALMAQYADVISPMAYPSHYPDGFIGLTDPVLYPYEVIAHTLKIGMPWLPEGTIVRPWYQDFDVGAFYGPEEVRAQIQAGKDNGLNTWFLWNARNSYTYEALIE